MLNIRKSFDGNDRVCLGTFLREENKDKRSSFARFFHVEVRLRVGIFCHSSTRVETSTVEKRLLLAWRKANHAGSPLHCPPLGTSSRDRFIGSRCILLAFGKEVFIFIALANAN